jgi:hypothetical protein
MIKTNTGTKENPKAEPMKKKSKIFFKDQLF